MDNIQGCVWGYPTSSQVLWEFEEGIWPSPSRYRMRGTTGVWLVAMSHLVPVQLQQKPMHVGFLQGCALSPTLFIILMHRTDCCSQVVQALCFDGLKISSLFFVVLLICWCGFGGFIRWWPPVWVSQGLFTSEWRMRFTDGLVKLDYYIVYCPFWNSICVLWQLSEKYKLKQ